MEKFRNNLVQVINDAKLPIGEAYYVLKDVFRDVQDAYKEALEAIEAQEKEEQMAAMQAALDEKEVEELITEDDLK